MKGQQNFKIICQRVQCDDKQLEQINQIENNPYLVREQQMEDGFILHKIPYDECICLNDLIDAIKFNYIVIYKGQAILIIKAILQHLIKMGDQKLCHYQLNLNNVFIQLKPESNKFTTYQSIIQIDKIFLVQYLIVQDPQKYELNLTQDVKDFKKIINQLLEHYKDQKFNILIKQVQDLKDVNDVKAFKQINDILDQFIQNHVDVENQIMKVNELENYNKIIKQRYYCETELLIQLNDIQKIQIQFGEQIFDDFEKEKQENETLKESEKLQQYILSHFQPYFVKQFQKYYGDKLQNSYLLNGISKKQYNELLQFIEKDKQRATRSFEAVKKVIDDCFSQSQQIKIEIFNDFKFDVDDLPKSEIMNQFYKFYIKNSLDHDLTQEEQYKLVNQKVLEDVKLYIQEQYEMANTFQILKLIGELI
ncbi:unnamed protein product [Paramecium pentaurelia]|uniref:Uncharacterized protein n=2 Tax=Paramecium pentaurelia TaxID=43138 RepID=A0A8S1SNI0_9CILI|nr:unnamed protein product [Paramecium pentaurelia]